MAHLVWPAAVLMQGAALMGLLPALATDLRSRTIPNAFTLWVLGFGLVSRVLADGLQAWLSLVIAVVVFFALAVLARRDLLGGGDAKMIGAVTFLVEPARVPSLLAAIVLSGGVLALVWFLGTLALRKAGRSAGDANSAIGSISARRSAMRAEMPYAIAIVSGVAITLIGRQ